MNNGLAATLSIILGIGPMLLFAYLVYWTDRFEREPLIMLGGVFFWGAVIAAVASFLVNSLLGLGIYTLTASDVLTNMATSTLIAPVVEESLKGFAILIVFLVFRKEFDSILDGIVYAAIAALGFAATENVYYIYTYGFIEGGYSGLLWLVFVRVVLVGWQHPFYTSFTGIGLAIARLNKPTWIKFTAPLIGLALSFTTHAVHNLLTQVLQGTAGMAFSTLLDWSGWVLMFLFGFWALNREQKWITTFLREEVELGNMNASQYQTACSAIRQLAARTNALFSGKYRSTHRFYLTAAELAYKKYQLHTFGDEGGNIQFVLKLRATLAQLSGQALV